MKGRLLGALLCIVLCAAPAGFAVEPAATEPAATEPVAIDPAATEPAATEPVAIEPMTMMGFDSLSGRSWEASRFFERMAGLTGVSFTFQQYGEDEAYSRARRDVLEGETPPHVLFKAGLTPSEELRYAQSGTLIDLAPLLRENAPNLWALLEERPEWREAITLPDGKIVALPALTDLPDQVCIWINKSWLDTLNLDMPDSPESLRAVLTAFRDGDPNQNGRKDEIPLYLLGPWEAKWLTSFFGLAANDYNLYLDEEGSVRYAPLQPEFAEFLAYLRGLYDEGLLGSEAFSAFHGLQEQIEREASTLRVGALISMLPTTLLDDKYTEQYAVLAPFAYGGRTVYRDLTGSVWRGAFAVTRTCPDPAAALRWADALYAEQGAVLAAAGEEGTDYAYGDGGKWSFLVDEMRSIDSLRAESLMDASGDPMPGVRPSAFWAKMDSAYQERLVNEIAKVASVAALPIPLCYLTEDEQAEIDALQAVLGPLVDEAVARFAIGETPLDEESLAAFEQALLDAGADRLVALWQGVLDARR